MIRLHVTAPLAEGHAVAPTLDQSRYLTQVMRLKQGDDLLLFNGEDGEWRAEVLEILKKGVILRCVEQTRPQAFGPDLELILAGIKKARVETVVEKAAELGAKSVQLVITQRTNAERIRLDRLDAIAEEAAEQTGRLDVPVVHESRKLSDIIRDWPEGRKLMFCDETGGEPAIEALQKAGSGAWSILIGPEGGFSPEEREMLRALPFTTAVSLGPRILRADTAAISAMTLWQYAVGDWER
ncbi:MULTISPECIES: 16S rRNA (uracil(1498)-N(3))-methyltransferase [unclassified Brevundimonas]|uniref:16S rRNA (uracil(1498)-N(3))-methyltransferase n=1 Tax=unclassified Brevundimonas TaxID=2622653 RepID=UPI0025BC38FD|nr:MULTISPECIES: 16S rRNA (uracil(1498)-N(3))-methyltransferase [unclassified Brevundimonas]